MTKFIMDLDEAILNLRGAGFDEKQIATILHCLSDVENRQMSSSICQESVNIRGDFRIIHWMLFIISMLILAILIFSHR